MPGECPQGASDNPFKTKALTVFEAFRKDRRIPKNWVFGPPACMRSATGGAFREISSELAVLEDRTIDGDTGSIWAEYSVELPTEAFSVPIKIEFRFEADDIDSFAGWYIDDFAITVPAP